MIKCIPDIRSIRPKLLLIALKNPNVGMESDSKTGMTSIQEVYQTVISRLIKGDSDNDYLKSLQELAEGGGVDSNAAYSDNATQLAEFMKEVVAEVQLTYNILSKKRPEMISYKVFTDANTTTPEINSALQVVNENLNQPKPTVGAAVQGTLDFGEDIQETPETETAVDEDPDPAVEEDSTPDELVPDDLSIVKSKDAKLFEDVLRAHIPLEGEHAEVLGAAYLELRDTFLDFVADANFDMDSSNDGHETATVDPVAIIDRLQEKLYKSVTSYYEMISSEIYSNGLESVIVLADEDAIPKTAKRVKGTDNLFTDNTVRDSNGVPITLSAGPFDTKSEWASDKNMKLTDTNMDPRDLGRLDLQTVADNFNDLTVKQAFYGAVMISDLDVFMGLKPHLNATYKAKKRFGSANSETIGSVSDSAVSKMVITSTPILPEATNSKPTDTITNMKSVLNKMTDPTEFEAYIHKFDRNGNNVGSLNTEGESIVVMMQLNKIILPVIFNKDGSVEVDLNKTYVSNFIASLDDNTTLEIDSLLQMLEDTQTSKQIFNHLISKASLLTESTYNAIASDIIEGNKISKKNPAGMSFSSTSAKTKYLDEASLNSIAPILAELNQDNLAEELRAVIYDNAKVNNVSSSEIKSSRYILRSFYHRMFDPNPYKVSDIDPSTGLVRVREVSSFARKANMSKESSVETGVINLMESRAKSVILKDKQQSNNGKILRFNMATLGSFTGFMNKLNTSVEHGGRRVTAKVLVENDTQVLEVRRGKLSVKLGLSSQGNSGIGRPFKFEDTFDEFGNPSGLSLEKIVTLQKILSLPTQLADMSFVQQLHTAFKTFSGDSTVTLESYITNMVALKVLNDPKLSQGVTMKLVRNVVSSSVNEDTGKPFYGYQENMFAFNVPVTNALDMTFGKRNVSQLPDAKGNKSSTDMNNTKEDGLPVELRNVGNVLMISKDFREAAGKTLHARSPLVGPDPFLRRIGTETKKGASVDTGPGTTISKSNSEFSRRETLTYLMDISMTQVLIESDFKEISVQAGAMSDRTSINTNIMKRSSGEFMPVTSDGKLDRKKMAGEMADYYQNKYKTYGEYLNSSWTRELNANKELYGLPEDLDLDTTELSFKGMKGTKLIKDFTPRELYNFILSLKVPYDKVQSSTTELVQTLIVEKGPEGMATIPFNSLQNIELFADREKTLEHFRKLHSIFKAEMKVVKPNIQMDTVNKLKDRFPGESSTREVIYDTYFLTEGWIGDSLLSMHSGFQEQYKNGGEFSLFGTVPTNIKDPAKIINNIKKKAIGTFIPKSSSKKSITEMTHEELVMSGRYGSRLSFIKTVLENKVLTPEKKLELLEFDEIEAQRSPRFINQVKRNQGLGTSLQMYALAQEGLPGMRVSKNSKNAVLEDYNEVHELLGNINNDADVYDATQFISPVYAYKSNQSLGGRMSNYFSTGNALKDINVSNLSNGTYILQKKASALTGYYETILNGSPEYHGMMNLMTDSIVFPEGTEMYLNTEHLYENEGTIHASNYTQEVSTDIPSEGKMEFLIHGESLGDLRVAKDSVVSEAISKIIKDDIVDSNALMYLYRNGEITKEDLSGLNLSTYKQLRSVTSVKDIMDELGGIDKDMDFLALAVKNGTSDEFQKSYPAGVVAYFATEAICNYPGIDGKYALRDMSIEKVGFVSQEKTGSVTVNPADAIKNPRSIRHSEVPNDFSGLILDMYHNSDVTAELSTKDAEDQHGNSVKLITQAINAVIAQGEDLQRSENIFDTIGLISDMQMDFISHDLVRREESYIKQGVDATTASDRAQYDFAKELVEETMRTKADSPIISALIKDGATHSENIAFALKQMTPLLRTAINSKINKKTVSLPWAGGQYIVAASHHQFYDYNLNEAILNRLDFNKAADRIIKGTEVVAEDGVLPSTITKNGVTLNQFILENNEDTNVMREQLETLIDSSRITDGDSLYTESEGSITSSPVRLRDIRMALKYPDIDTNKELLENLFSGKIYSINHPKGERLKWNKYEGRNGEVMTTEEFRSYYIMEKGFKPSDKAKNNKQKNEEFVKFLTKYRDKVFGKDSNELIVPSNILARYVARTKEGGINALTTRQKAEAVQAFNEMMADPKSNKYDAYITELRKWMSTEKSSTYKNDLKTVLDSEDDWFAVEAEFYMPPLHQAAYLIDDGDSLHSIIGTHEQPNPIALLKLIPKSTLKDLGLTPTSFKKLLDNYSRRTEADSVLNSILENVEDESIVQEIEKYKDLKDSTTKSMQDYFSKKLGNIRFIINEKGIFDESVKKRFEKRFPEFFINITQKDPLKIKAQVAKMVKESTGDPILHQSLLDLQESIKNQDISGTRGSVRRFMNDREAFIASTMVDNFSSTLTFFTARIPGQGKQSGTVAKVKNFIFGAQNASYGPLEMLTVTGADYDGDKQNVMTWSVDNYGQIIKWDRYESKSEFMKELKKASEKMKDDSVAESMEAFKNANDGALPSQDDLNGFYKKADSMATKYEDAELERMSKGLQNKVLSLLMDVYRNPKNAIEANTPISMDNVSAIKNILASKSFEGFGIDTDINFTDIMQERGLAYAMDASVKGTYENVNAVGKGGVGIFANTLKSYLSIYYGTVNNPTLKKISEIITPMSDIEFEQTFGDRYKEMSIIDVAKALQLPAEDINNLKHITYNSSNLTNKDGKAIATPSSIKNGFAQHGGRSLKDGEMCLILKSKGKKKKVLYSSQIANTTKYSGTGQLSNIRLQKFKSEMAKAKETLEGDALDIAETSLIEKYKDDLSTVAKFDTEDVQAWEMISEMLSSATDNAKELILSVIGADKHTSSAIIAVVTAGFPLKDGITLFNNSAIRKVIEKIENESDIFGDNPRYARKLIDVISDDLHGKYYNSKNNQYKSTIDVSDPLFQALQFLKLGEEMGKVASVAKINQGIPVKEFDVYSYMENLRIAINPPDDPFKWDVYKFIEDSPEGEAERQAAINDYDSSKFAVNVPYIISQNKHYFGQIKGLLKGTSIVDSMSFIMKGVRDDLQNLDVNPSGSKLNDKAFSGYINFVNDIVVHEFLSKDGGQKITLRGKSFKLANPVDRENFIKEFPTLIQAEAVDNGFQDSIFFNSAVIMNRDGINLFRMKSSNNMKEGDEDIIRINLEQIKRTSPDIYNAIVSYSLIVDKGGLGSGSMTSFLSADAISPYKDFVHDLHLSGKGEELLKNVPYQIKAAFIETQVYNPPRKLEPSEYKELEEATGLKRPTKDGAPDNEAEFGGQNMDDIDNTFKDDGKAVLRQINNSAFAENKDARAAIAAGQKPVFLITTQGGQNMAWHEGEQSYVLIERIRGSRTSNAIMYDSSNTETISTDAMLQSVGFQYGIRAEIAAGITGRIMSFDNLKGAYRVMTEKGRIISVEKEVIQGLSNKSTSFMTAKVNKYTVMPSRRSEVTTIKGSIHTTKKGTLMYSPDGGTGVTIDSRMNLYDSSGTRGMTITSDFIDAIGPISNAHSDKDIENQVKASIDATLAENNDLTELEITQLKNARASFNLWHYKSIRTGGLIGGVKVEPIKGSAMDSKEINTKDVEMIHMLSSRKKVCSDALLSLGIGPEVYYNTVIKNFYDGKINDNKTVELFDSGKVKFEEAKQEQEAKNSEEIQEQSEMFLPENIREEAEKKTNRKMLKAMANELGKRFNNTKVQVMNSKEISDMYGDSFVNSGGFTSNGVVVINSDKASQATLLHEFGHIYLAYLKDNDPALYKSLVKKASTHELMSVAKDAYSHLKPIEQAEEVFVELLGRTQSDKFESSFVSEPTLMDKIRKGFREFLSWMFGGDSAYRKLKTLEMDNSLGDVLNIIGDRIAFGKGSILNEFSTKAKTDMKLANPDRKISLEQVEKMLIDNGMIRKVCN